MSKEKKQEYKESKAVIIGDIFTPLLDPLTRDTPYLLLPICGIPIIEILLNSLSAIKEIIICIKDHETQIKTHLDKYHRQLNYKLIYNEDFTCILDCLRQIKQENYISSDFILIKGLTIINTDFEELYNAHIKNKERDNNCMITSVMKKFKITNETKTNYDENILIYNDIDKRIYQFEPIYGKNKSGIFKGIKDKENIDNAFIIRSDLIETGVDICSAKLLEEITNNENIDLQTMRDFIGQMLSEGIFLDTFYLHEISKDGFCGLIRNVESYLKVNFELLNRWAYPIVIDNIDMNDKLKINLKQIRFGLYSDKDANTENFHKGDLFDEVVILNKENTVGKESRLKKCVLCKDVKIGENCDLYNCVIFRGTKIGNNVIIKNSILGKNCHIKSGVQIISSVIGSNVELIKDSIQKRISYKKNEENGENLEEIDKALFLKNLGRQSLYLAINSQYGFYESKLDLTQNKTSLLEKEEFYSDNESEQSDKEENFAQEVEDIITLGKEKNKEIKHIINEIWNLRNELESIPTFEETLKICLTVILKQFLEGKKFTKKIHLAEELTKLFNYWKPLLNKFIPDDNVELNFISVLEQICIEIDQLNTDFHILVRILNNKCGIIKDQTIINWYNNEESSYQTNEINVVIPDNINKKNKKDMKEYVNDLNNEGDEEEEEEEDDEEN